MTDDADKTNHNGKGRPSKFEQLEIEKKLRPFFTSGLSSYTASRETNYSVNTVKKYYKKWYKEIRDSEAPEFVQACNDRRISTCLAQDEQLLKAERMQKELEEKTRTDVTPNIQLYKLRIRLIQLISDLLLKKLNTANSPTLDDMLTAFKKVDEQK